MNSNQLYKLIFKLMTNSKKIYAINFLLILFENIYLISIYANHNVKNLPSSERLNCIVNNDNIIICLLIV